MKTFRYVFSDGHEMELEPNNSGKEMIEIYCRENNASLVFNGFHEFMGVGRRSTLGVIGGSNTRGDGFKTGYNPALGAEVKSPSHYKALLKEKGLHEVGNEKQKDAKRVMKSLIDAETIKEVKEMGAEIGDVAAEHLMSDTTIP